MTAWMHDREGDREVIRRLGFDPDTHAFVDLPDDWECDDDWDSGYEPPPRRTVETIRTAGDRL